MAEGAEKLESLIGTMCCSQLCRPCLSALLSLLFAASYLPLCFIRRELAAKPQLGGGDELSNALTCWLSECKYFFLHSEVPSVFLQVAVMANHGSLFSYLPLEGQKGNLTTDRNERFPYHALYLLVNTDLFDSDMFLEESIISIRLHIATENVPYIAGKMKSIKYEVTTRKVMRRTSACASAPWSSWRCPRW